MSRKWEHSVGGRQFAKRKKAVEKQEGPAKKSKQIEEKCTTEPAEVRSPQPAEPSQDSSDSTELPDIPWVHTWRNKRKSHNVNGMPTWNCPLHRNRIPDHENRTTADETWS